MFHPGMPSAKSPGARLPEGQGIRARAPQFLIHTHAAQEFIRVEETLAQANKTKLSERKGQGFLIDGFSHQG